MLNIRDVTVQLKKIDVTASVALHDRPSFLCRQGRYPFVNSSPAKKLYHRCFWFIHGIIFLTLGEELFLHHYYSITGIIVDNWLLT
jgi:hypothetical protein